MFKSVDLFIESTSPIKSAWRRLVTFIQEHVEHNRVTSLSDGPVGSVVFVSDDKKVSLATAATDKWTGVTCQPVEIGGSCVIRTDGYAFVRFNDGLTMEDQEGKPVWISSVSGVATNDDSEGGKGLTRIGILADASEYVGVPGLTYNPYAYVCLGYVCGPVGIPIM